MTITIAEDLMIGTHSVRFDVVFSGKITSYSYDRKFTYKRLQKKLEVIAARHGRTKESITEVKIQLR